MKCIDVPNRSTQWSKKMPYERISISYSMSLYESAIHFIQDSINLSTLRPFMVPETTETFHVPQPVQHPLSPTKVFILHRARNDWNVPRTSRAIHLPFEKTWCENLTTMRLLRCTLYFLFMRCGREDYILKRSFGDDVQKGASTSLVVYISLACCLDSSLLPLDVSFSKSIWGQVLMRLLKLFPWFYSVFEFRKTRLFD